MPTRKKKMSAREKRHIRVQQILFAAIAVVVILSWILSLVSR
jgi:hypothetical protein